jgi:hypothetical protein
VPWSGNNNALQAYRRAELGGVWVQVRKERCLFDRCNLKTLEPLIPDPDRDSGRYRFRH